MQKRIITGIAVQEWNGIAYEVENSLSLEVFM